VLEAGLYTYVSADVTLTGLISDRLYPLLAPQESPAPYVTFQRISTNRTYDLAGPNHLTRCRIQFDCYGVTLLSAKTVAEAVRERIDGYMGSMGSIVVQSVMRANELDLYEPTTEQYRTSSDYWIVFVED